MFQKSFSGNRFNRNRFQNRARRGNGHGQNQRKKYIDPTQYVNKAAAYEVSQSIPIKHNFSDFQINSQLKQNILTRGYKIPTPIQDQGIPCILTGKDVVGIANTGTGKTAAFLVPLINKIVLDRRNKVIIVVPTRELAVQVNDEVKAFARFLNIYSVLCIGGVSLYQQINTLSTNPNIVIGTPGRLKDLINRGQLNLFQFRNIVLDEVDRMVDIGFIHDIRFIISKLPQDRQSLFFSATITAEVNSIIASFTRNPVTISVKVKEIPVKVDQDVISVKDKNEKINKLTLLLRQDEFKKVLIFGRTKWGVEKLSKALQQNGFTAASIHGNKTQNQRLRALSQFKQNQLQVLVATDIAARGLDIDNVSHVINYDEPSTYTDYIHRIGRTGRADKQGKALTFVM